MSKPRKQGGATRGDTETLHALQKLGPSTVAALAEYFGITGEAVRSRTFHLKKLGMATRELTETGYHSGINTSVVWSAAPGAYLPPWQPKTTERERATARAWRKRLQRETERIAAGKVAKSHPRDLEWAPKQIRTTGSIPANLPPPTLAGTFSQLNRSNA